MISKAEAARLLGVTRPTVYKWIGDGTLVEPIDYSQLENLARARIKEAEDARAERQISAELIRMAYADSVGLEKR